MKNDFTEVRSTFDPKNDIGMASELNSRKIWITSDTHFNHKNILVYESANRPFKDRTDMDEQLISRWNSVVGKDDVVFHLGDFAFAGEKKIRKYVERLNGRIYLLLGNHDRVRNFDWNSLGFARVLTEPFLFDGMYIMSHEPLDNIPDGKVNLFGHVHGSECFKTATNNSACLCVERWNCTPVDYDFVRSFFD